MADEDRDGPRLDAQRQGRSLIDDFFDASKASLSVAIVSSRAASESDQSGGGTEDDPVGPVMLGAACPTADSHNTNSGKVTAVDFVAYDLVRFGAPRR